MCTHPRRGISAFAIILAGLLFCQPRAAQAQPGLVGKWSTPALVPPGGFMVYDFAPGCYVGNGIWRGTFNFSIANYHIVSGLYELRMYSATEGTIGIFDQPVWQSAVGNVDFNTRVITYKNVAYRQ